MVNRFILNEVSYFGAGARKQLPDVLKRLNLNKALVATDKGLLKVGTAKMVTDVLDEAGFAWHSHSLRPSTPYSVRARRCHCSVWTSLMAVVTEC